MALRPHVALSGRCSRPCGSRLLLKPVCIHKEYSKGGLQSDRPSSNVLLTAPEDIVIECLTLMRKGELSLLAPYIPHQLLAPPGSPVAVAGVPVHEQGPLACCAPFMDTAARRVLPGHLLRRARILSSLQLGGSCLLRVSLTACTGEEVLLNWRLGLKQLPGMAVVAADEQQQQHQGISSSSSDGSGTSQAAAVTAHADAGAAASSSSSSMSSGSSSSSSSFSNKAVGLSSGSEGSTTTSSIGSESESAAAAAAGSCWQVLSVERDTSADADSSRLKAPHPRTSPELVVLTQLHALQQQDIYGACGFNLLGRHASGSGWDAHLAAFRHLLSQPHYHLLSGHDRAELGSSGLPSQRHFLQEVLLYSKSSNDSSSSSGGGVGSGGQLGRFLWRLGMQADGCWMVRSIEAL